MSDFNYQEYLKNNPLFKEKIKNQIISESQSIKEDDVEDVKLQSNTLTKLNAGITNFKTMAKALISIYDQLSDKEQIDFTKNPSMKIVLDRLKDLADVKDEVTEKSEEMTKKYDEDDIKKEEMSDKDEKVKKEEESSKIKVSELKAKIKEDIISLLNEDEEDIDIEDEMEVDVDVEEPTLDSSDAQEGLSKDEKEIQDALKIAYDNAIAIGDKKLADQIGNSITFFTRSHVVER